MEKVYSLPVYFLIHQHNLQNVFILLLGYFQYAGGFEPRKAYDVTAKVPGNEPHDPMFIIEAVKSKNSNIA